MSNQPVSHLPDSDMQAAPVALMRAAQRAREIARQTGTGIIVIRDGEVVEETSQPGSKPSEEARGE